MKDAAVIGAGAGGLSTAIILSQLGYRVTVLEKNREAGGMMRSYFREGCDCPVGIHYLGSLGEGEPFRRLLEYLGIAEEMKLKKLGERGIIERYILDDEVMEIPEGIENYRDALKSYCPDDAQVIDFFVDTMSASAKYLSSFNHLKGIGNKIPLEGALKPVGKVLDDLGASDRLKKILDIPRAWMGVPVDEAPTFFHTSVLGSYLLSSWKLDCTSIDFVNLFLNRISDLGSTVICGKEISRILVRDKKIQGVELAGGETIEASLVISTLHPQVTLGLLPEDAVKSPYKKRIRSLENTGSTLVSYYSLPDDFECPGFNQLKIDTGNGILSEKASLFHVNRVPGSKVPVLSIVSNEKYSDWEKYLDVYRTGDSREYDDRKQECSENNLKTAREVIGPCPGAQHLDTFTPLSIERWLNTPEGSIYGVKKSTRQLLRSALLNRTSVEGLFLAGQSVLSPGIMGTILGSFDTVKHIVGPECFASEVQL